ncbi:hypothetical protein K1T71_004202 [Dendrolimus kikuchii]|uniref:Uncharacterized protein n=1 Tax=Dendrolimus kikuchii TaxID=765133 RepID=A0ACC1DA40_9NEOP|nr:hypothetical protein K1T71_004202 [Dendrolimus kikuchii]
MSFKSKVVLITGASAGIGAATAVMLAKEGANVAIVGRNKARLNNVAAEIAKVGSKPLIITIDIVNDDAPKIIIDKTIERYGRLDILVNNAGMLKPTDILKSNFLKDYDEIMNTNLRAAVAITNYASSHIIKTKGNIINISSTLGKMLLKTPDFMAYCISKAGIEHFTRAAALAFGKFGVRVNTISPGGTRTDICETGGIHYDWDAHGQASVLGKVANPEEVAELIMFVASDKAGSITGSDYCIDNGDLLIN